MSYETNNVSKSTCNYVPLGMYSGTNTLPNTLGNIEVQYPVASNYQIVPHFAGFDYKNPNYNSLVHGSCINYAGINQAYIDCGNSESAGACSKNGGRCVQYEKRMCGNSSAAFGFKCNDKNCIRVNEAPNARNNVWPSMQQCQSNCGAPAPGPYAPRR